MPSSELLAVIVFLEDEFYMQWKMDNYPHPVFPFFDGTFQPSENDTAEFLKAMKEYAEKNNGNWGGYDPSEMEDWVGDRRIELGFKTQSELEVELEKRKTHSR